MKNLILEGELITTGLEFPEGPVAMADGSFLVVEIAGARLTKVAPTGEKQVVATLGGGPNGAAIGPDGLCYVCNNGGFTWLTDDEGFTRPTGVPEDYAGGSIQRVNLETGASETLYTHCDGIPLHGPNDIIFDSKGGFWFTDWGKKFDRHMMHGSLYYGHTDGSLIRCAATHLVTANGVALSPDEDFVYVAETETSRLWRYPITGEGEVGKENWPSTNGGQFVAGLPGFQRFDSMALEECGNICIATFVSGGISVVSPEGELLEFHKTPEVFPTNICFGGADMQTAYITLSGYGQLLAVRWPRPGLSLAF